MRYAAGFALLFDASVTLVYEARAPLIYSGPGFPASAPVLPEVTYERLNDEARSILDEAKVLMAGFGVEAETRLVDVIGNGAHAAEGAVEECDLIIKSKDKPKGLRRLFGRGEFTGIAGVAKCPVIVIYAPDEGRRTRRD